MNSLHTLLIIEDDKIFREILRSKLADNFLILEASNRSRAINILEQYKVHSIVMDFYLDEGCGLDLIQNIRQITKAPLIVLSGEHDDHIKLQTYENGADDFVTKPCNMDLVLAKIKSYINRIDDEDAPLIINTDQNNSNHTHFDKWTLDRQKFQAFDDKKQSAELTMCEYTLLDYLIRHAGRAISREELCDAMKDGNYRPAPRALDVKITRLRKKIEKKASTPNIIQTIRGVGYMFDNTIIRK